MENAFIKSPSFSAEAHIEENPEGKWVLWFTKSRERIPYNVTNHATREIAEEILHGLLIAFTTKNKDTLINWQIEWNKTRVIFNNRNAVFLQKFDDGWEVHRCDLRDVMRNSMVPPSNHQGSQQYSQYSDAQLAISTFLS